jgi:hypothetical protein
MNNETNEAAKYPAVRPEIMAEILVVDCHITDLILKTKGNARELDKLVGVLDAHLACCEFDRDSLLLGVSDQKPSPALPTITDLPAGEQRLIFEAVLFGAVALETLRMLTSADVKFLARRLAEGVELITANLTTEQITEGLQNHLREHQKDLMEQVYRANFQGQDN